MPLLKEREKARGDQDVPKYSGLEIRRLQDESFQNDRIPESWAGTRRLGESKNGEIVEH